MRKSRSLFKLSATALTLLYGINKFIDCTATAPGKNANGNYYHWKHGDVYYKKQGHGEPLLLIHDTNVFSSNYEWSQVINKLANDYTVYAIDLIGCGKSDKPEFTYTNFFYVQMINDFVKDVTGTGIKVAATGLSSSFVIMTNSIHKDLFKEIIMINPKTISSLKKAPDDRSKILIKLFNLPVIGKAAYYLATCKPNVEYYLTEKCFYNPFHLKTPVVKAYYDAAHTSNGKGKSLLASLEGYYLNIDISNALKNTDTKMMILTGEYYEKKNETVKNYLKINPSIVSETITDSKYLPQLENPNRLVAMISDF